MNFYYKYYLEIKNRLILILFSWSFLIIISYIYKEFLLFILIDLSNYVTLSNIKPYFIFTNVHEVFYVYLNLILFITNQLTFFLSLYHGLIFLSLGLYQFELKNLKLALKTFFITWCGAIFLLYKFLIPISWNFFLSFQENSQVIQPVSLFFEAKISDYFGYFTELYYICMLNCQFLALIVFFLSNISGSFKRIKTLRKLFYLIFVVFSTLTTPPDILSQIILSFVLILSYEFFIFIKYLKINMATN